MNDSVSFTKSDNCMEESYVALNNNGDNSKYLKISPVYILSLNSL